MSIFVLNVASVIGLGISIDYSLFMTRRFRDELLEGRSITEAVGWTIATSGEAILFSGLIVMIGFAGLLLIGVNLTSSFGIGGAVVVAISVLAALTLLPSLLSVLGPRINALRIPFISRFTTPHAHAGASEAGHENGNRYSSSNGATSAICWTSPQMALWIASPLSYCSASSSASRWTTKSSC